MISKCCVRYCKEKAIKEHNGRSFCWIHWLIFYDKTKLRKREE